jgi:hypothetical protein
MGKLIKQRAKSISKGQIKSQQYYNTTFICILYIIIRYMIQYITNHTGVYYSFTKNKTKRDIRKTETKKSKQIKYEISFI